MSRATVATKSRSHAGTCNRGYACKRPSMSFSLGDRSQILRGKHQQPGMSCWAQRQSCFSVSLHIYELMCDPAHLSQLQNMDIPCISDTLSPGTGNLRPSSALLGALATFISTPILVADREAKEPKPTKPSKPSPCVQPKRLWRLR